MQIIYEDRYLIAVKKPINMLSEGAQGIEGKVKKYLEEKGEALTGLVNRLDFGVSGLILLAKTKESAKRFNKLVVQNQIKKEYLAVVHGVPTEQSGTFKDILFKDSKSNKSFVVKSLRKGAKEAELDYCVVETKETPKGKISLVKVRLKTGRTHQIRVQFSSRKMPLVGDGKYGGRDNCDIALYSYKMTFNHPFTNKTISIESMPEWVKYPWNEFSQI